MSVGVGGKEGRRKTNVQDTATGQNLLIKWKDIYNKKWTNELPLTSYTTIIPLCTAECHWICVSQWRSRAWKCHKSKAWSTVNCDHVTPHDHASATDRTPITVCSDSWLLDMCAWKRRASCQTVHRTEKTDASDDRLPVFDAQRWGRPWSCAAVDRSSKLPQWLTESAPVALCHISRIASPQSQSSQQASLERRESREKTKADISI